jgi:hypothetical protein
MRSNIKSWMTNMPPNEYRRRIRKLKGLPILAKMIWEEIADSSDDYHPKEDELADRLGTTRKTIRAACEKMVQFGVAKKTRASRREPVRYDIIAPDEWPEEFPSRVESTQLSGVSSTQLSGVVLELPSNIKITNKKTKYKSPAPEKPKPHMTIWEVWQELRTSHFPKTKLTDTVKRKLETRWKEKPEREYWQTVIEKFINSKFCQQGRWADFRWLIKNEDNHDKVFCGNYDNDDKKNASAPEPVDYVIDEDATPW